jgi:phenylpyruvate tautomerase PptA (4-oxalocrotonate tautomerase family)
MRILRRSDYQRLTGLMFAYQQLGVRPINAPQSISNALCYQPTRNTTSTHLSSITERCIGFGHHDSFDKDTSINALDAMPLYDIEHVIPLTDVRQEALAKAFTSIHCKRFHTPSFFINVRFTDVSTQKVYRGGVLRYYNRAILRTRVSENRTREQYGEHCRDLIKAWDEIIGPEDVDKKHDKALRTVWIMGALTTAVEMGFQRPAAGEEIEWLRSNKDDFERLAIEGDEDMQQLMEELRTREDFSDVLC